MKIIKTFEGFLNFGKKSIKKIPNLESSKKISADDAFRLILRDIDKEHSDFEAKTNKERDMLIGSLWSEYSPRYAELIGKSVSDAQDLLYPRLLTHFVDGY